MVKRIPHDCRKMDCMFVRILIEGGSILLLITSAMLVLSCTENERTFDLGDAISAEILSESDTSYLMISSATIAKAYEIRRNDIVFRIAVDEANRVTYISTSDPAFSTDEGISMASSLRDVKQITDSALKKEPGWAYHIRLPSGWRAAFVVGGTMTDAEPDDRANVSFFFKR
jgi:hypothetical protein